jgi:hypothetical protein
MQYVPVESFQDVPLNFNGGVAAIDVVTLKGAGAAVEPLVAPHIITLPGPVDYRGEASFEDLMKIDIRTEPSLSLSAIIDTKKMTWGAQNSPTRKDMTDYLGGARRGVSFLDVPIFASDEINVVQLPVTLHDGRSALMWFAELPLESLQAIKTYELFNVAKRLVASYDPTSTVLYDELIIPAQQIDYTRKMVEIMSLNAFLGGVEQIFKVALDETGARVYVETKIFGSMKHSVPAERKVAIFGSRGPVVFWLTDVDQSRQETPFAVVATMAEAWLDTDQEVKFEFFDTE